MAVLFTGFDQAGDGFPSMVSKKNSQMWSWPRDSEDTRAGATGKDLRVKYRPPADMESSLEALLAQPWIRKVPKLVLRMIEGIIGGVEDMGGEFELGKLVLKKMARTILT